MFGMLSNLAKAAVSVAVTPVTAAVDAVMLPVDATEGEDVFKRTGAMLKNAGDCVQQAVKPEKDDA